MKLAHSSELRKTQNPQPEPKSPETTSNERRSAIKDTETS